MPKWIDENTVEGEMKEQEFQVKVRELMAERIEKEKKEGRPRNYGNDGVVQVFAEEQEYKGIHFQMGIVRYFSIKRLSDSEFKINQNVDVNSIGKWVVVEGNRPSADLRDFLNLDEFLWHDTLHSGQEGWTLRQMWEYALGQARDDISEIESLLEIFDQKVALLQKELVTWLHILKRKEGHATI